MSQSLAGKRDLDEMVDRLESQLKVLQAHYSKAFIEGDEDFVGEVATKLRLLLHRKGANKPLLFEVAERHSIQLLVNVPPRPVKREQTPSGVFPFEEHLGHCGYIFNNKGEIDYVSYMTLILVYCDKMGGAHEDWEFGKWATLASSTYFTINDLKPHALQIKYCADLTLDLGAKALQDVKGSGIHRRNRHPAPGRADGSRAEPRRRGTMAAVRQPWPDTARITSAPEPSHAGATRKQMRGSGTAAPESRV